MRSHQIGVQLGLGACSPTARSSLQWGLLVVALLRSTGCAKQPIATVAKPSSVVCSPGEHTVILETTRGDVTVEIHPEWAPKAAERFGLLVDERFYDGGRFYRVVPGFVVQGGLNPDLAVNARWAERKIPDDPAGVSNRRGTVVLARTQHPDSATTQFFISDHAPLDDLGYRPFGCVSAGMDVVDAFYAEYGEVSPVGSGPSQKRVIQEGEAYLSEEVPLLDRILRARRPRRGRATRSSDRSGR